MSTIVHHICATSRLQVDVLGYDDAEGVLDKNDRKICQDEKKKADTDSKECQMFRKGYQRKKKEITLVQ